MSCFARASPTCHFACLMHELILKLNLNLRLSLCLTTMTTMTMTRTRTTRTRMRTRTKLMFEPNGTGDVQLTWQKRGRICNFRVTASRQRGFGVSVEVWVHFDTDEQVALTRGGTCGLTGW